MPAEVSRRDTDVTDTVTSVLALAARSAVFLRDRSRPPAGTQFADRCLASKGRKEKPMMETIQETRLEETEATVEELELEWWQPLSCGCEPATED